MKEHLSWFARRTLVGVIAGGISGFVGSVFVWALNFATENRQQHSWLIWALPAGGAITAWISQHWAHSRLGNPSLIIEQILKPKRLFSFAESAVAFLGTLLSHAFGASTGREGAVVFVCSSLSEGFSTRFRLTSFEKKNLLIASAGAAFGVAVGAPISGLIFGLEFVQAKRLQIRALFESSVASVIAYSIAHALQTPHFHFSHPGKFDLGMVELALSLLVGVCFGAFSRSFIFLLEQFRGQFNKLNANRIFAQGLGGFFLALILSFPNFQKFQGFGFAEIQSHFQHNSSWWDWSGKALVTLASLGFGFMGGEFVPLVYMGSSFGSFLSTWIHLPLEVMAALGFVGVFAGASRCIFACACLAGELFGFSLFPLALIACWASASVSGAQGIYSSQLPSRSEKIIS